MGCLQLAVVTKHTFLVINHPLDQTVIRPIAHRNIELNETGKKQAEETGKKLLNYDIDVIIASPLKRAKKTAEIIRGNRNIEILLDDGLKERAFGEFEGKTREEFDFNEIWNYKLNKHYERAESTSELFERVQGF